MALDQQLTALARANKIRYEGARIRREVKAGELTVGEAMEMRGAQPLRLSYLLQSQTRWGVGRMRKLLRRLDFNGTTETRRIRELTNREKELLVYGLEHPDFWVVKDGQLAPDDE